MLGVVVATHGPLATALVETAKLVVRDTSHVIAVSISQQDDAQTFEQRFIEAVHAAKEGRSGVLVLTDMFGGTPSTLGMTLHQHGEVEVLTGVNLPMLIKVLQLMNCHIDILEVARQAQASAMRSIAMASQVLSGEKKSTDTEGRS